MTRKHLSCTTQIRTDFEIFSEKNTATSPSLLWPMTKTMGKSQHLSSNVNQPKMKMGSWSTTSSTIEKINQIKLMDLVVQWLTSSRMMMTDFSYCEPKALKIRHCTDKKTTVTVNSTKCSNSNFTASIFNNNSSSIVKKMTLVSGLYWSTKQNPFKPQIVPKPDK